MKSKGIFPNRSHISKIKLRRNEKILLTLYQKYNVVYYLYTYLLIHLQPFIFQFLTILFLESACLLSLIFISLPFSLSLSLSLFLFLSFSLSLSLFLFLFLSFYPFLFHISKFHFSSSFFSFDIYFFFLRYLLYIFSLSLSYPFLLSLSSYLTPLFSPYFSFTLSLSYFSPFLSLTHPFLFLQIFLYFIFYSFIYFPFFCFYSLFINKNVSSSTSHKKTPSFRLYVREFNRVGAETSFWVNPNIPIMLSPNYVSVSQPDSN